MGLSKIEESSLRVKYIRLLERFIKSMVSTLSKDENLTKEKYTSKVDNSYKYLQKMDTKVTLYKQELIDMEKLVEKVLRFKDDEETPLDEIRLEILRDANQIEKSKNRNRYKRDKKSSSKYGNWD